MNLLFNSSKTEFLITGVKQQLSKINNTSFSFDHSVRNLGLILTNILYLLRSDHPHHFLNPAILISVISAVYGLTLILKQPVPSLAASIVHSKLDCCNSLYYNLLKFQIDRFQQNDSTFRTVLHVL